MGWAGVNLWILAYWTAFMVNATLFSLHVDGSLVRRALNASGFGPGTVVNTWSNNIMVDLPDLTGIFFDPETSSVYYTVDGDNNLYRRGFVPESGIFDAVRSTVTSGNVAALQPNRVLGMFLVPAVPPAEEVMSTPAGGATA